MVHKLALKLLIASIVGLAVGVLAYSIQPQRYKAEVMIDLGGKSDLNDDSFSKPILESPAVVIERIKSRAFILDASKKATNPGAQKLLQSTDADYLAFKTIKNSNVLLLSVTAKKPDIAAQALTAVLEELSFKQNTVVFQYKQKLKAIISANKKETEAIQIRICDIQQDRKRKVADFNSAKMTDDLLIMTMMLDLERRRVQLADNSALLSSYDQTTFEVLEPVTTQLKLILPNMLHSLILFVTLFVLGQMLFIRHKN